MNSSALGGAGGDSELVGGLTGGSATAGSIDIKLADNATLTLTSDGANFDASALGGTGGVSYAEFGVGGTGGKATAGALRFDLDSGTFDARASLNSTFNLGASGGAGADGRDGYGANGPSYRGEGGGFVDGTSGGTGGDAVGGTFALKSRNGAAAFIQEFTLDLGTRGGNGGKGGKGGRGADGDVGDTGSTGAGMGGRGGNAGDGSVGGSGGNGGFGGNAAGGRFNLISQTGGSISLGNLSVDVSGTAGRAGNGGAGGVGGDGGEGGSGGFGNGGEPGGAGGNGGNGGLGGIGGNGSTSGNAMGGIFSLDADGGSVAVGTLTVAANGYSAPAGVAGSRGVGGNAGSGGFGGYDSSERPPAPDGLPGSAGGVGQAGQAGSTGAATGGMITLRSSTNTGIAGSITAATTRLDALGGLLDGQVFTSAGTQGMIGLSATGVNTVFQLGGLTAYTIDTGDLNSQGSGGAINLTGNGATMDLGTTDLVSLGAINVNLTGSASVRGGTSFTARSGAALTVFHSARPNANDSINAGTITLRAGDKVDAGLARFGAVNLLDIAAANNVTLGSAYVAGGTRSNGANGPVGAEIRVAAGADPLARGLAPHSGNVSIVGTLDASGSVRLTASNDIIVNAGATVATDNRTALTAGGDVRVAAGASLVGGRAPIAESGYGSTFNQNGMITIDAGAPVRAFAVTPGDISSIIIGGTLDARAGAVTLRGAAIDATGSTIASQHLRADISGATNGGSNDLGTLRPGCTESRICLGAITASGTVEIGRIGAPLSLDVKAASLVDRFDVNAVGDIRFGDGTSAFTVRGNSFFNAASTSGNIVLSGPVTLSGGNTFTLAGNMINGLGGNIVAGNDLVLKVPGGVAVTNLDVGGQLRYARADNSLYPAGTVIGDLSVPGQVRLGASNVVLSGIDDLTFGQVVVSNGAAVALTSTGGGISVNSIGNAPFGKPGSITVNAFGAVMLGHAETSGNLSVTGASFTTGLNSIITQGDIDINVQGLANLGNSMAGGHADVTAGAIIFNSLTTGAFTRLVGNTTITGGTVTSGANAVMTAPDGITLTGLNATSSQLFAYNGLVDVSGLIGSNVSVNANSIRLAGAGDFSADDLNASDGSLTLEFGGNIALGSASAGTTMDLTSGGTLQFSQLFIRDDLTVNAASVSGDAVYGNGANMITAPGGITIANLNAGGDSGSFLKRQQRRYRRVRDRLWCGRCDRRECLAAIDAHAAEQYPYRHRGEPHPARTRFHVGNRQCDRFDRRGRRWHGELHDAVGWR